MIPYITRTSNDFPEMIMGVSSTPTTDHLLKIRDLKDAKPLPESQAVAFHHTTAQLLFFSCTQRDILNTVAFFNTRVESPDEDDWGKIKRVYSNISMAQKISNQPFLQTPYPPSNCVLMHHIKHMMIAKDTQALSLLLVKGIPRLPPTNRNLIQKAQLKLK
jgi:hypothetical protein